ncbi:MAG TPA: hypothetical protein P5169_08035 [Kiritimatiellia bacterium]|jgi:hypothetical protein|nr:hypothetical protein [Kiritimatiellia bacterium]
MMRKLKRTVLSVLAPCGEYPMPEPALTGAVRLLYPEVTISDVRAAVRALEEDGYVIGVAHELIDTTWSLTPKGIHLSRQLP